MSNATNPEPAGADPLGPTVILPAPASAQAPASGPAAEPAEPAGSTAAGSAAPGWFGKLPMLGDFASRRLPDTFVKPWDDWLQASLAVSREATGERWLDLYLTFPVWRFVVPAGLIGDSCWIGVFLPSVDRVGRCFPLTICQAASRHALEDAGLVGIDRHLSALAALGVEALDASSVEFLEQQLTALAPLAANGPNGAIALEAWLPARLQVPAQAKNPQGLAGVAWPLTDSIAATLCTAASRFVIATLADRVLWWSPAAKEDGGGALLLEPFPFSGRLLGNLIGTG